MAFFFYANARQILNKVKSYSHGEFYNQSLTEKEIEMKILNNTDIFNRGFELKKIELDKVFKTYFRKQK